LYRRDAGNRRVRIIHYRGEADLAPTTTPIAQAANVRFWHKADMLNALMNVRFWGQSGH
jgi:hypothetical protein